MNDFYFIVFCLRLGTKVLRCLFSFWGFKGSFFCELYFGVDFQQVTRSYVVFVPLRLLLIGEVFEVLQFWDLYFGQAECGYCKQTESCECSEWSASDGIDDRDFVEEQEGEKGYASCCLYGFGDFLALLFQYMELIWGEVELLLEGALLKVVEEVLSLVGLEVFFTIVVGQVALEHVYNIRIVVKFNSGL